MAKFDIEYAGPVKVQSTAAYARPQTEEYEQLARLGQGIFQIGAELQDQKVALEYSQGQRQISEQFNSAMDSLTGDEQADAQILEKLQQDIGNVQFDSGRVNRALEIHRNRILPDMEAALSRKHQKLFQERTDDQFEAEGQTLLAKGNLTAYDELLARRLQSGNITLEKFNALSKSALQDSLLQQARDLMASDSGADRQRAVGILENLPEAVELTTDQKWYRNKLLKLAKQTSTEASDAAITNVVIQKNNLKNATALEKQQAADKMKQDLVNGGVVGDKLNQWFGILDEWSGGDKDPTEQYNPQLYAGIQAACQMNPESITDGQIYAYVGGGTDDGITTDQAEHLVKLRQTALENKTRMGKVQNELHRRYQDILKGMYNANFFKGHFDSDQDAVRKYTEVANRLTVFANTNPDATIVEYENYFNNIVAENKKQSWWQIGLSWIPATAYYRFYKTSLGTAKEGRATTAKLEADIQRITDVRQRILTDAWARRQQREKGNIRSINGQIWRLTEKGETPDKDVYERIE